MKKNILKLMLLVLTVIGIQNVNASDLKWVDVNFNYGGNQDDKLWDIDFFSDGSYVVVGESKSSFNSIVHEDDGNTLRADAIIAIFDKNNNLLKEYSWTTNEKKFERFYDVTVIDDNNFLVCGEQNYNGFCKKYNKSLEEVWSKNLVSSASQSEYNFNSYKTSKNNYFVSIGDPRMFVLNDSGTIEKENIYMKEDSTQYSNLWPTALLEHNNKFYVGGSISLIKAILAIYDENMNLLETKEYENYEEILDVDVLNNSLLLSVDTSNRAKLVQLNENYEVSKEIELGVIASDIDTQVLSNGNIVVTICESYDSTIYLLDSSLNIISSNSFINNSSSYFKLVNTAVNPINNVVYAVGYSNAVLGNIKNNGEFDGIVVSYNLKVDDASNNTNVEEEVIITPQDTPVVPEDTPVVPEKETSTSDSIENPETGAKAVGMTVVVFSCLIFIIKLIARRKKIFNKI